MIKDDLEKRAALITDDKAKQQLIVLLAEYAYNLGKTDVLKEINNA
jgi:hypothetical protein